MRRLSRQAAKAEPTYWVTSEVGEPYLTDRYGRPLAAVKAELPLALDLAETPGRDRFGGGDVDSRAATLA